MKQRLLAFAAIAFVACVFATVALPAGAASANSATYYALSDCQGVLVVDAPATYRFVVRNEQPDGSYATFTSGYVDATGRAQVTVPHVGPTSDSQPQYVVYLAQPDGTWTAIFATGTLEEEWWLD